MAGPAVVQAQAQAAMRAKFGVSFNRNMDLGTLAAQWATAVGQNPQLAAAYPALNSLMQSANSANQALSLANAAIPGLTTALQIIETSVTAAGAVTGYAPATPINPGYTAALAALTTARQAQQQAANAIQPIMQQILSALNL